MIQKTALGPHLELGTLPVLGVHPTHTQVPSPVRAWFLLWFLVLWWKVVFAHLNLRLVARHGYHLLGWQLEIGRVACTDHNHSVLVLNQLNYRSRPISQGAGYECLPRPHVVYLVGVVQAAITAHSPQGSRNLICSEWSSSPLLIMLIECLEETVFGLVFQMVCQEPELPVPAHFDSVLVQDYSMLGSCVNIFRLE